MNEHMQQDAAFGPMGSSPEVAPSDAIKELQTLLNMRGYGPLVVNGGMDTPTAEAIQRAGIGGSGPFNVLEGIAKLKAMSMGPTATSSPANVPWYKQPKYLLGAAAILGVVGYVAYRSGALDGVLGDDDADDEPKKLPADSDFAGLANVKPAPKSHHKSKPKREKCGVLPDDDDEGDVIPPPEK